MKMRYFETKKGRVEIIPMIDVMLFLLVFFIIVTLQMIPDAGVNMQLPVSSQTQTLPHPKFTVNVLAAGTIKVKGQVVDAAGLTALLKGDGDPAKTEVTIAADKTTAFQHFLTVIDAARAAGVSDIGIAAQPVPGQDQAAQPVSAASSAPAASAAPAASSAPAAPPAPAPAQSPSSNGGPAQPSH